MIIMYNYEHKTYHCVLEYKQKFLQFVSKKWSLIHYVIFFGSCNINAFLKQVLRFSSLWTECFMWRYTVACISWREKIKKKYVQLHLTHIYDISENVNLFQ
jgi:hypothetical protein